MRDGLTNFPRRFAAAALIFFTIGIFLGAVYASGAPGEMLSGYFSSFFGSLGKATPDDIKAVILKNFIIWISIFISASFMPGSLLNVYTVVYRGFVTGYTAACFCVSYGARGMLFCCAMLPEMMLCVPLLVIFSAFSLKMSFSRHEIRKNFLKNFLIISFFSLTIFCVLSLCQAFLTTIFMNMLYTITGK